MPSFCDFKNSLSDLVDSTKRDLAWIAAIHVALKSRQQDIIPLATQMLVAPEIHLGIQNLSPAEARKERDKAIKSFRTFCDSATEAPSDNPGHYLNKSAILYTDAILQGFLDRTYEVIACFKELSKKHLKQNSISGKLNEFGRMLPESSLRTAKHVKFIAQLRHTITHNNGFVNDKFLKKCGINPETREKIQGKRLWDKQIWSDASSFLKEYKPSEQVALGINEVIIPYLKHSIEFVEEVLRKALEIHKPSP